MPARDSVAVLLATHNGDPFVAQQVASLAENSTRFTLHWLDDYSTDATRDSVRSAAAKAGIELREWHQPQRQNLPGAFFRLLELVEADFYLFCDQDDIWQPGKIDATVAALRGEPEVPRLCYSEPWLFSTESPTVLRRYFQAIGTDTAVAREVSRAFVVNPAVGNTVGLNRSLRDIFMRHSGVASAHAAMHDYWMYLIGLGSGRVEMLRDVPTTLYRQHSRNALGVQVGKEGPKRETTREFYRSVRRRVARQARGFIMAAETLPADGNRGRLLACAKLAARLDERTSLRQLLRLARQGILPAGWRSAAWLAVSCLLDDASAGGRSA